MSDYDGILLEEVRHMFLAIREGQKSLAHVPKQLDDIHMRLSNVESDLKIIIKVVSGHSNQLDNHEARITTLETA